MDEPLIIRPGIVIPATELHWRFDPAGGPGGQHANKAATRAELSLDLAASPSLPGEVRRLLLDRLGARAAGGIVRVSADESRSQWRNRRTARRRLAELLTAALDEPRPRHPTRPTAAARLRRLADKRRRAELRRQRRRPGPDD